MVTTTIDKAGRLVLPKQIREELQIRAGDTLAVEVAGGEVHLRALTPEPQLRREGGFWVMHGTGPITNAQVRDLIRNHRELRSQSLLGKGK